MHEIKGRFSVIMPVLNSREYLPSCVDSILAAMTRYGNAELIVIDNGSTDGSYELLLNEYAGRLRVQQIPKLTVAGLRNRGAALATSEFLAFIDSDCLIGLDYFEQALAVLRGGADATGSKVALEDSPHWIEKTWHDIHTRTKDGFVGYINSGNFVIRRQVFLDVGGFDPSMVTTEDAELGLRLNHNGFKLYEAHRVRAVHLRADKSLRVFFRKTAWRSLGMFGLLKNTWISKPVVITFAHLILCLAAVTTIFLVHLPLTVRLVVAVLLFNIAPTISVLYRGLQMKHFYAPLRAILLYHVYFLARFYAMCQLMIRRFSTRRKRGVSAGVDLSRR